MRPPVPTVTPMRLSRFATLWDCSGEVVTDPASPSRKLLYEPLLTLAPDDAEPYCCYACTIIFYERGTHKEITRVDHYNLAAAPSPHLVNVEGRWYEVQPRHVVWRNYQWYFVYTLDDRTRAARLVNMGRAALAAEDMTRAEEIRQQNVEATEARRRNKLTEAMRDVAHLMRSHHSESGR